MKKFRLYLDKDKEEKWLNEMSSQGWAMRAFFAGMYVFTPCEPGEYIYRVDMPGEIGCTPMWKRNMHYSEYVELVEETGAEYVCRWGWWVIFRREAAKGAFELYTDTESQIALYKRIRRMFILVGSFEFALALQNTGNVLRFWDNLELSDFFWFSGSNMLLSAALALHYFVVVAFFYMLWKLTRKIRNLGK